MDLLTLLAASRANLTASMAGHLDAAVNTAASSIPAVFGMCAAAGIAAAAVVARQMRPAPEAGQVWIARRRDLRGMRVRITDTGLWPTALVLTAPPGALADQVVGAPVHLPVRGRRLAGFHPADDPSPLPHTIETNAMTIRETATNGVSP